MSPADLSAALRDPREWTVEDLAKLPDGRYEIVDGRLLVVPPGQLLHTYAALELAALLRAAAPPGIAVLGPAGTAFARSYRVPDVLVVRRDGISDWSSYVAPVTAVVLAVEVMSPASVTDDRLVKPHTYAAAGIGHFWRFEPAEEALFAYRLAGAVYTEVAVARGQEVLRLTEPFPIEVTPAALLP